jgi:serine/threonine-protein kinase
MTSDKSPPAPEYIGKYRIEKVLGKGAMGVVYLARDPTIDRPVALKTIVLPEGLDDQKVKEFRARFLMEARAAGRLSHPSIVTVYEADDGARSGIPFIAMEYVEGLPWNYKIRRGAKQDPDSVLPLIREIASALAYAHQSGVIHRDIKPANIVQTPDGHVKLMDFGIAKIPTSELTREGQFLGTPAYMSPEQVMGKTVDGRSDLFSLGTVLYELLTCQKPFPGEEMTSVGFRICKEQPRPAEDINPDIPPDVRQILRHLLEKSADDRYATAVELVQDIDAYMAGAGLPHAGTTPSPATTSMSDSTVITGPPSDEGAHTQPAASGKQSSRPTPPRRHPSFRPGLVILGLAGLFVIAVAGAGALLMVTNSWGTALPAPPVDKVQIEPVIPPDVTARAEAILNEPVPPPPARRSSAPAPRRNRGRVVSPRTGDSGESTAPAAAGSDLSANHAEGGTPEPAKVSYLFSSKILRGEFQILVDGTPAVKKVIHRKFSFRDAVYSGTFTVPPGTHEIAFRVKTKIQNISEIYKEKQTFKAGKDRRLKIVMTRFNKEIHFEWGG